MIIKKNTQKISATKVVVTVGIFSAISFLLQLLGSFAGLKVAGFLEIEFSDIPALILSLAYGPLIGVMVEFIKNVLHCFVTTTGLVGELANFVTSGMLCLFAGIIYKKIHSLKGAVISLIVATFAMAIASVFVNRFIMLPMFMPNAPKEAIINLVISTILPFNIIKGLVLSLLTFLLYKRISKIIK